MLTASSQQPTLAVTGAAGLLGRHLSHYFYERGWEVRGLVRNFSVPTFGGTDIRLFKCDLPEEIDRAALEGVDILVHCAYMTRFTNLAEARRVNEEGTKSILEGARAARVRHFVFVSSTGAYSGALSYYGRSKYLLEGIMDPERDLVIRPGLILAREGGLFQRIVSLVQRFPVVPILGGGKQIVQTVHVEDLCQAFELAINRSITGLLNVAEPEGLTMKELLQLVATHLRRRRVMLPLPNTPIWVMLRLFERFAVSLPISSENLLGLTGLRHVSTAPDLKRHGLKIRNVRESLATLLG
jgi:nucleoside-diphosphate-sugar epimerase